MGPSKYFRLEKLLCTLVELAGGGGLQLKLKCHQNLNVSRTEMSPKLKCHQKWIVPKTELLPKLKFYYNKKVTKTKKKCSLNSLKSIYKNHNQLCVLGGNNARYKALCFICMFVCMCLKVSVNYGQPVRVFAIFFMKQSC